jgi:hypothetical protein
MIAGASLAESDGVGALSEASRSRLGPPTTSLKSTSARGLLEFARKLQSSAIPPVEPLFQLHVVSTSLNRRNYRLRDMKC